MFGIIKKLMQPQPNPIGIDFGSDSIKMAQVRVEGGEHHLGAAASADVPSQARRDPAARLAFFVETVRDLLAQGGFRGRQAVLSLPASWMFIQHLRLPPMDDEALRKALPWEAKGKLPIDPSHALLRHLVAGEIYHDQEPKNEIILLAAARETVNSYLDAAARAHLDVVGMNVEPRAVVDCFSHIYRRKTDADVTNCFVDIGSSGTRVFVARSGQVRFARAIPIGGESFNQAVASELGISLEDARLMRLRLAHLQTPATELEQRHDVEPAPAAQAADNSFALLGAGMSAAAKRQHASDGTATAVLDAPAIEVRRAGQEPSPDMQARQVEQACREQLQRLVEELDLCRRYYETTFPSKPMDRLVFIGGQARHRSLCQFIAREMGLTAQVGDPLVRMGRVSEVGMESGIDRRQPQPAWCVAIGLSLGSAGQGENNRG